MGGKSTKQRKSESTTCEKKSPLDHFVDGTIIFLTCKASGKLLRIHEDKLDGLGEEVEVSQFTVHKKESESGLVVTLQSVAYTEKHVQICEEQVGADGTGDEQCELKVVVVEECVTLESVKASGQYIAVQEDGSVHTTTDLGPSAHFTPSSAVKEAEAKAETPPADEVEQKTEEQAEKADDKPEEKEDVEAKEEQSPTES